jgi:hypothetical protein
MDEFVGVGFVNSSLNLFICSKFFLQSEILLYISVDVVTFAQQSISGTLGLGD